MRNNLRKFRIAKDKMQKEVAAAVEITTSAYGMIEIGVRKPNLPVAKKIADYFEKTIEEIFFEIPNNIS